MLFKRIFVCLARFVVRILPGGSGLFGLASAKLTQLIPGTVDKLLRKRKVSWRGSFSVSFLVFALVSDPVLAQPQRNLQVMERLLREGVISVLDSVAVPKSAPLAVEVQPREGEVTWFVRTRLLRDLEKAGFQEVLVGGEGGQVGSRFTLRVDGLDVAFQPVESESGRLLRRVAIQLSGLLRTSDGRVLWSGLIEKAESDTVRKDDVARLEESPYEFTYSGSTGGGRLRSQILEAVGLSVMLGVITYLFYSYRTR